MVKYNIKKLLFIFIILIVLIMIGIGIWKLLKTENYVKFRNLGKFPPNGYIYEYENTPIIVVKDKNNEYEKHMRYIKDKHHKLNSIRNRNFIPH